MVFSFSWYVAILPPLLFIAIFVVGLFLFSRKHWTFEGGMLMLLGASLLFLFGPQIYFDRVTVTATSIYQNTGYWFAPTKKGFEFKDVASIKIGKVIEKNGFQNTIWMINLKSGVVHSLDPGDLWDTHNDEIIPLLRKAGIKITEVE